MLLYFCAVKLRHDSRVRNATNRHLFVLRFSISLSASLSLTFGSPNLSEKTTLSLSFERVPTSNHVQSPLRCTKQLFALALSALSEPTSSARWILFCWCFVVIARTRSWVRNSVGLGSLNLRERTPFLCTFRVVVNSRARGCSRLDKIWSRTRVQDTSR